jgi:predicted dehydrogenase
VDKVGFGIVGAGLIGQVHAETLAAIDRAELRAVYNRSPARGKVLADRFNVPLYDDYDRFLACNDLDAVIICTPSGTHVDFALPAAKAGKHLIVEKPLEITVARCTEIIEAAEERHVTLSVIFQNRFKDAVRVTRAALEEGRLGRLVLGDAHVKWYRPENYYQGWKGTKQYDGGGALMNQGIHTIDLLQWMMGPVVEVYGYVETRIHRIEVEDVGVATLRFRSGALGVITSSTATYPGLHEQLGIYGENGSVELSGNRIATWQFRTKRANDTAISGIDAGKTFGGSSNPARIESELHHRQLEAIATAILEGKEPPVDGNEAKKSVAIIEAIYESNQTRKPIILN